MSHPEGMQPHDAFAELARITLSEHSLDSVMRTIADLTRRTVPGASEVSVSLVERGEITTVASTGQLATQLDERQYAHGYGPCLTCVETGETVLINNMTADERWPDWAGDAVAEGAGSTLTVPVTMQRGIVAALNIYGTAPNAFDPHSVELAATFSAYAGVSLANMHLYQAQGKVAEQLQTAMKSRAVIEQAKGILMAQRSCTADDAFAVLSKMSQDSNRKLRDVAQEMVDKAEARGA